MIRRLEGKWMATELKDMLGKPFVVGDKVAKACTSGRAVNLEIGEVTRIEAGRMYMDGSKVAIRFPGRLLIVTKVCDHV